MTRMTYIAAGVLIALAAAAGDAAAQWNVARFETRANRAYTSVGLDPALVATVGYGRVIDVLGHPVQLTGDAGLVSARMDADDFRVRLGMQSSLLTGEWLRLTGSATFITRGTSNTIYRGINLGADVTAALGVYRSGWFVAGELGKDKAIITHLTHTDWYRDNFHPDAKDGWYLDAGGTIHYGAVAGVSIGRAELVGRAGWSRTEDFNDLSMPVYVSLGLGFGF